MLTIAFIVAAWIVVAFAGASRVLRRQPGALDVRYRRALGAMERSVAHVAADARAAEAEAHAPGVRPPVRRRLARPAPWAA
ncbi:MAG TPA: hypothetical protein VFP54_07595 [Acidimicrobiales bacterium]|nr:hypothetical protein [Acidimicrobiales bacterium]